jgi:hypothetical protein
MRSLFKFLTGTILIVNLGFSQVTIDGYAYLENQSDHSGITITFERTVPSSLTESTTTDENGHFTLELETGVYDVGYARNNYFSYTLMEQALWSATTLPNITLIERPTIFNVPSRFSTIQGAIDSTLNGDTVLVQPGTYNENIRLNGKDIVIGSLFLSTSDTSYISSTIINGGGGSGITVAFRDAETEAAKLIGFTIQNGSPGIFCSQSNPTLYNLIVSNNNSVATNGGGVLLDGSSPNMSNMKIVNNVGVRGAGIGIINNSSPNLQNVIISGNLASYYGGGIYCYQNANPVLENVIISENTASIHGGGIHCSGNSDLLMENVNIQSNTAIYDGGGICISSSQSSLSNVTITNNTAEKGGGIQMGYGLTFETANVIVSDNTAISGGGIYLEGSNPILSSLTVSNNNASTGAGIYCRNSGPVLTNSIISHNAGSFGLYIESGTPSISYNDVHNSGGNFYNAGEWVGVNISVNVNGDSCDAYNNIQLDPLFVDYENGDYHLSPASPCIDAGDPASPLDPDGSIADMGALPSPYGSPVPILINIPSDYSTIQAGLNAANTNDTVLVQPGTYYENIIWPETNGIKLMSAGDSSNTIIDGGDFGRVIFSNQPTLLTNNVIEGFRVINGSGSIGAGIYAKNCDYLISRCSISNNHGSGQGGGIYGENSELLIKNSSLVNNTSLSGGAIYIVNSNLNIDDCLIMQNSANPDNSGSGGGIYSSFSTLNIINSNLENNSAKLGGGIWASSSALTLTEVNISGSMVPQYGSGGGILAISSQLTMNNCMLDNNYSGGDGGAIKIMESSSLTCSRTTILENVAGRDGGGIIMRNSTINVIDYLNIISNSASRWGGGICHYYETSPIRNCNFYDNTASAGNHIYRQLSAGPIEYCTFIGNSNNGEGVLYEWHEVQQITNCNFLLNGQAVISNSDVFYLNGIANYWGHSSGPYHPSQNSTGQGDSTNQWVDVTPWETSPITNAPPIPAQNVSVSGTGNDFINLVWDPSPLGDFAGFKLYYDTDETGYPYENSIDIGSNTSYSLSGLSHGTEYFLAVTVYDTDGNESWYSIEASGVTRVMAVQNLDIAGDEDLFHLISHDPSITFDYFDSMGEVQTDYQAQISIDSTFQSNLIWDTGEVVSDATSVQYTEGSLQNGMKYYLRARVASGSFWSNWTALAFGMNTEPSMPIQLSLIDNEVTTSDVFLSISNSIDAEGDNLSYDFRLYDATQIVQLDSAMGVAQDMDVTVWEVTTALDDNAQHWWTVKAYDGYEYSELAGPASFLINFENDPPAGFNLTSPMVGEAITSQAPLFTWDPAADPDPLDTVKYVLYLDTPDPGVETFDVDVDTSFQLSEVLEDNTSYHWKVVAHDLSGATATNTGGYQSFTVNTSNDLPAAFELLSPVADMMVTTLTPEFLWEASSDPDDATIVMRGIGKDRKADQSSTGNNSVNVITGYDFYLSPDADLVDAIPVEVFGPSYTPETALLENQVYYWAVSALDDSGGVTFSDTASFWTNSENSAPVEFALLTPVDDTESTSTPTFTWTLSSDADLQDTLNYTLRYGTDVFNLMDVPNEDSPQFTVVEPLEDNTDYIWQVVAEDISGAVFSTEFSSFFVNSENDDPGLFSLIAPDSAAWITNGDLMLIWEPSTDLEGADVEYVIHMGSDSESLNPIDTIGVNYFSLNALEDGYYSWQIEALDNIGGSQFSETWSFMINVHNDPPDPFALTFPEADLVLTDQQPTFTWEASSSGDAGDHTSYRVELGNSAETMDVVYEGDSIFYTPELSLEDNSVYYWRVIAIDLAFATTVNEGGYQSFVVNTVNDAPSMAELISPDSVVVLSDIPTFSWNASTDVDPYDSLSYELHWWTDVAEMDSIITTATTVSPTTPLTDDNLQYFWNVITMDANGGIAHSEEKTFWVDFMPEVPASFALLGPDSASAGNGTRPELTWAEAIDPDPFDAVHYSVAVATDSLMENVIYEQVAHVEVTIPEMDLENDTRYYWQVTAIDDDSLTTVSTLWTFDVGYVAIDQYAQVPREFMLDQNYPNPFNPSTTIRYGLPEEANVSLVIYDVRGQVVQTIASGHHSAGWYDVVWNGETADGKTISTGIYFARLVAGDYSQVIKMLYLK